MTQVKNTININTRQSVEPEALLILDQLYAIVYVCDIENGKILYMNSQAKKVYGEMEGKICWEVFQKEGNSRCSYCSNEFFKKQKNEEKVVIRDHFNAFDDNWYEVQDRIILWTDGRKAKLQVAYNIDHRKEDEKKLIKLYTHQELFSKIAISFNNNTSFANKVNDVLALIGKFVDASRVSIFENKDKPNETWLTYEWCKNGIAPKINRLASIKYSSSHSFYNQIIRDNFFIASDLEDDEFHEPFSVFRENGVRALLLVPVYLHGKHTGFLDFEMVNEIRIWKKEEIKLLKTLGNIISTSFERKLLEEKRIRYEHSLKEANATKDKFFSIVTNNLLTPFTDLKSLSTILLENFNKWDDNKRIKFVKSISESSDHGYKLLENLMTWSKIQSGQLEFMPQKIDLRSVINLTFEQLKAQAEIKKVTLEGLPDDFVFVFADYLMVNAIFKNLVSNAIKFNHTGGLVNISLKDSEEFVEISVADNGIGIEKPFLNQLFRIDLDNMSFGPLQEKGTGLGLIICRELVEKHGGQIWVESKPGKGSAFKFTLPKHKKK
ncbi:MAG: GAF domain-containing sensor histidine kinase [Bacteroidales bacterium]